jgi:hypothetical protein
MRVSKCTGSEFGGPKKIVSEKNPNQDSREKAFLWKKIPALKLKITLTQSFWN